jgi:RNA polymerase sigma-70 factor (ECF subfamily)
MAGTDAGVPEAGVHEAVTRLARGDGGRVTALLATRFGDLDLADESVQDALVEAVSSWPACGVPDNPAAWLLTVARNKAVDRLRREGARRRRALRAADAVHEATLPAAERGLVREEGDVDDPHLRLLLLCCHPALHRDTQVALTLRLVGGLTTSEIAAAFLQTEAAVTQRIVRAKRKIRLAGMPLSIPGDLDERVDVLLGVLYLVFNEGYLPRGGTDGVVRVDLADEAVRLTRLARALLPGRPEVDGLLALLLYARSRFAARTDEDGELVLLEDQDRSRWDTALVEEANQVLAGAVARRRPGTYQLQAVIASYHANARRAADTDWPAIELAYRRLASDNPSPVVRLNHAVAEAMADGPDAGLARLAGIEGLDRYHLFHAVRGDLLARTGDTAGARAAFGRARALTTNPAEQRLLDRRLSGLG